MPYGNVHVPCVYVCVCVCAGIKKEWEESEIRNQGRGSNKKSIPLCRWADPTRGYGRFY